LEEFLGNQRPGKWLRRVIPNDFVGDLDKKIEVKRKQNRGWA
jgi:hypothetical protein